MWTNLADTSSFLMHSLSQRRTNTSSVHGYDPIPPSICCSHRLRCRIDDDNDDFGTSHIIYQCSSRFADVGDGAEDDALDINRRNCHLRCNDIDNATSLYPSNSDNDTSVICTDSTTLTIESNNNNDQYDVDDDRVDECCGQTTINSESIHTTLLQDITNAIGGFTTTSSGDVKHVTKSKTTIQYDSGTTDKYNDNEQYSNDDDYDNKYINYYNEYDSEYGNEYDNNNNGSTTFDNSILDDSDTEYCANASIKELNQQCLDQITFRESEVKHI